LIKFGKDMRKLAENPFQREMEEARREMEAAERMENGNENIRCRAALLLSTSPLSRILFPIP
jgi:hypothetical protein